jgi:hypothetical protein
MPLRGPRQPMASNPANLEGGTAHGPPEGLGRAIQMLPMAATQSPPMPSLSQPPSAGIGIRSDAHPIAYSALRVSDKLNAAWIDWPVDTQGCAPCFHAFLKRSMEAHRAKATATPAIWRLRR